ncbi:hypothetical protein [Povalibacter sp.]
MRETVSNAVRASLERHTASPDQNARYRADGGELHLEATDE